MIKYIAVGILAYMFYAGVFKVGFSEAYVGIGFNPTRIINSVVSDIELGYIMISVIEREIYRGLFLSMICSPILIMGLEIL